MNRLRALLDRLDRAGRFTEDALLVVLLTALVLLAAGQIVLRNFLGIGFIWADEALRMLVLWLAVAGAVAASRGDKHINIAILDRFLPGRWKNLKDLLVHVFTAGICGVVAWNGLLFVQTSREFGDLLLDRVPAWLLQIVLPVGFGLICYRYAVFSLRDAARLFARGARS